MNAKTLESLIERAAALSEEARAEFVDAVADAIEQIEAKHGTLYRLSIEERAGIERGLKELRERGFASDEAVAAVFRRARNSGA
jgi:transcription elongation GreA/GreB family factor